MYGMLLLFFQCRIHVAAESLAQVARKRAAICTDGMNGHEPAGVAVPKDVFPF